jgi:peroxiredoxin
MLWGAAGVAGITSVSSGIAGMFLGDAIHHAGTQEQTVVLSLEGLTAPDPSSDTLSSEEIIGGLPVGAPAPDFSLKNLEGQMYALSKYRGKPLIVSFWEPWCPACQTELPQLERFAKEFKHVLPVFAITYNEAGDALGFVKRNNIAEAIVLHDAARTVMSAYNIKAFPTTYVIDPQGTVAYMQHVDDVTKPDSELRKRATDLLGLSRI